MVRTKLHECLTECVYYDEVLLAFGRMQTDCRDFLAGLRQAGVNLTDPAYSTELVLTITVFIFFNWSKFKMLVNVWLVGWNLIGWLAGCWLVLVDPIDLLIGWLRWRPRLVAQWYVHWSWTTSTSVSTRMGEHQGRPSVVILCLCLSVWTFMCDRHRANTDIKWIKPTIKSSQVITWAKRALRCDIRATDTLYIRVFMTHHTCQYYYCHRLRESFWKLTLVKHHWYEFQQPELQPSCRRL